MNAEQIKQYLASVLDVELNLYIQEETLLRMNNTYNSLGIKQNIYEPTVKKVETDPFGTMWLVGVVIGFISAVIAAISEYNSASSAFKGIVYAIIGAAVYGVIGLICGAFTVGSIVAIIEKKNAQSKENEKYELQYHNYQNAVSNDKKRIKKELERKQRLVPEIARMKNLIANTRKNLASLYAYDVINKDYRNIYAISSIYGYFDKGRTASLGFNQQNGDQGAYNIYENECRLNLIITNTKEILDKMDTVIQNQFELVSGLKNAERQIGSLCSGVSAFMNNTENALSEIAECQRITAYNAERTAREMEYLVWMEMFC